MARAHVTTLRPSPIMIVIRPARFMPYCLMSEEDHLALADRHIAEALQRIAEQEVRLRTARSTGVDAVEGQRLLSNFRTTLDEMRVHRTLIIDAIERKRSQR